MHIFDGIYYLEFRKCGLLMKSHSYKQTQAVAMQKRNAKCK